MELLEQNVQPFNGLDSVKLLSSINDVKSCLKYKKIKFTQEYQSNKGCTPDVPWTIIRVENSISFVFTKDK